MRSHMLRSLLCGRYGRVVALLILLTAGRRTPCSAQIQLWGDTYQGGYVSGAFSIGEFTTGYGVLDMPLPAGCTVRKATLFVFSVGSAPGETLDFLLGSIPVSLGPATAGPTYNSNYGLVQLHTVDLTAVLDPTQATYVIDLLGLTTNFKEYHLMVQYELPGADRITVDVFFLEQNSAYEENYVITPTLPMDTSIPIALGIMGAYARDYWTDSEFVRVNGTELGAYYGRDYNGPGGYVFGASATFHFAHGIFEGIGDDVPDQAIDSTDALSDLSGLVADGATSFDLQFRHSPTGDPGQQTDNLVNMVVVAYSSAICAQVLDLGADTTLCTGDSLVLDAGVDGVEYLWSTGSTERTITVHEAGTYHVRLFHPDCTWEPDTVVVDLYARPNIELGPDRALCTGWTSGLAVPPMAGVTYTWQDGTDGPQHPATESGLYTLTAESGPCLYTDSVHLTVDNCAFGIELPNVFTPNGDATNSAFQAISIVGITDLHISIHNRWGQEVFTSTQPGFRWDGRSPSGLPVPDGVYFWVLDHAPPPGSDVDRVQLHGTVMLLR